MLASALLMPIGAFVAICAAMATVTPVRESNPFYV